MSKEEAKQYDRRRARISEICTLLGKLKPVPSSAAGDYCESYSLDDTGEEKHAKHEP
jgi:hypothetical protein